MIKTLELINFRSWKDALIEFHPGVTVITGENDSGKTNILRGINWPINNRPAGEDVRSDWGGDTISRLTISDNGELQTVERFRSDSENLYKIGGQKEPFKAFGQNVPEVISKLLNFGPGNIQFQLEGPFLLGKSSSDIAKHYNDAVNLEIIDRSISNIARTLREEKGKLAKLKADQESQTEKLKAYEWLPEAEKGLVKLEKMQLIIRRLESEYTSLIGLLSNLTSLKGKHDKLNETIKHEDAVNALLKLDRQIEKKTVEYNELESLSNRLQALKKESQKIGEILHHKKVVDNLIRQAEQIGIRKNEFLELAEFEKALTTLEHRDSEYASILKFEPKANKLIELDRRIDIKTGEYNELFDLMGQWDKLNEQLESVNNQRKEAETEFQKSLPDLCPIFDVPCELLKKAKKIT